MDFEEKIWLSFAAIVFPCTMLSMHPLAPVDWMTVFLGIASIVYCIVLAITIFNRQAEATAGSIRRLLYSEFHEIESLVNLIRFKSAFATDQAQIEFGIRMKVKQLCDRTLVESPALNITRDKVREFFEIYGNIPLTSISDVICCPCSIDEFSNQYYNLLNHLPVNLEIRNDASWYKYNTLTGEMDIGDEC